MLCDILPATTIWSSVDGRASPGTPRDIKMAILSDLSEELVHRVIDHIALPQNDNNQLKGCHLHLDHIQDRPRAHLEHKNNDFRTSHRDNNNQTLAQVSWPEGLPSNKLLPLSLINRTFRQCAQERLFQNVALHNQWQGCLFLHELQEGDIEIGSSSDTKHPRLSPLAQHVHSLLLKDWSDHKPPSMGRGGGSLICETIRSCPSLENFAMVNSLDGRCKDPIMDALASRKHIKDFVVLKDFYGHPCNQKIIWLADEVVARLFAKWEHLEKIELHKLSGRPIEMIETIHKSIPVIVNCALRTIILTEPDLDEREFALILQSSRESLRTLEIVNPTPKLDRPGLCRILKECTGPDLESLTVATLPNWHIIRSSVNNEISDDPAENRNLLEILFKSSSALKNLKSLSIQGRLTGSELFIFLPPSIVKLSWGRCHLTAAAFAKALSSFIQYPPELPSDLKLDHTDVLNRRVQWLPKLKCCTVIDDYDWDKQERDAIDKALRARRVCFHSGGNYYAESEGDENVCDSEEDDDDYGCCC
ncbi:hypothetical protein PGTUg99_014860 [Puccinia graminis f. sp. tritici]|uniref:Uncharacterized protein n=1 Tax=Puccinia graminis f. sp. tritici TaxID=56615 RepID=A0A5B0S5P5_PUCGR|nr:hypothetical protein PGTUg99_014860 [Puccinia graminis f. sp. tritici]